MHHITHCVNIEFIRNIYWKICWESNLSNFHCRVFNLWYLLEKTFLFFLFLLLSPFFVIYICEKFCLRPIWWLLADEIDWSINRLIVSLSCSSEDHGSWCVLNFFVALGIVSLGIRWLPPLRCNYFYDRQTGRRNSLCRTIDPARSPQQTAVVSCFEKQALLPCLSRDELNASYTDVSFFCAFLICISKFVSSPRLIHLC